MDAFNILIANIRTRDTAQYLKGVDEAYKLQLINYRDSRSMKDLFNAVKKGDVSLAHTIFWNEGDTIFRERFRWVIYYTNEKMRQEQGSLREYSIVATTLAKSMNDKKDLGVVRASSKDKALESYLTQIGELEALATIKKGYAKLGSYTLHAIRKQ